MAQDADQVNTAEIRSQIERTRAELGHTIDAIQDRLSPRRVMHDAKETISDATLGRAKRLAHRMTEVVHSGNSSPNSTTSGLSGSPQSQWGTLSGSSARRSRTSASG